MSLCVPASELRLQRRITFRTDVPLYIERAVLREDFYDFFGLQSDVCNRKVVPHGDQDAAARGDLLQLQVTLFIIWRCDYRCPYCWQEFPSHVYRNRISPELPPEAWAEALNQLGPDEIHISGGEPCLYESLPRLISLIVPSTGLTIHTNFGPSFQIEGWNAHVAPNRVNELKLSFHPTQVNVHEFFGKLTKFVGTGWKNLTVAMPLFPVNLPYCQEVLDRCAHLNIAAEFQPYVPPEGHPVQRDRKLISESEQWIHEADRHNRLMGCNGPAADYYKKEQYWEIRDNHTRGTAKPCRPSAGFAPKNRSGGRTPVFCNAGRKRLVVEGTGDAYTCMSALSRSKVFGSCALPHYSPVGNIFSRTFRFNTRPILCWESFRCSADDFQHLDSAWSPLCPEDLDLPLPE